MATIANDHPEADDYPPPDQHVFMAATPRNFSNLMHMVKHAEVRVAGWDALPVGRAPSSIIALRLSDPSQVSTSLPMLLPTLDNLKYLEVPAHLIPKLTPEILPPALLTLHVGGYAPTVTIPEGLVFPQATRAFSLTDSPFFFRAETFPKIKRLALTLDRRRKMLPVVAQLHGLERLGIGPVTDTGILATLTGLRNLTYLNITNGNASTLDGIEQLPQLRSVSFTRLQKLADISALAKLPLLEEVWFLYCAKIDVPALLQIKSLKRVHVEGRTGFDALAPIRPQLTAAGIVEF